MAAAGDRLEQLLGQSALTGIDFVLVHDDQTTLDVHFFHDFDSLSAKPKLVTGPQGNVTVRSLTGAADVPPVVLQGAVALSKDPITLTSVATLTAVAPGGFAPYVLRIDDPAIDSYFAEKAFSFKAACPSDVDCKAPDPTCPTAPSVDFPVDYQARDFHSFRRALLDFAARRYPAWPDRLEADAGVMVAELLGSLGDEMAYYQDRVAREAYLETATERRSVRRHARLVDYSVHDGLGATAWLDIQVSQDTKVHAGALAWALQDGRQIAFEVGRGLADRLARGSFPVQQDLNAVPAHVWDETDACLHVGATAFAVQGHHAAAISGKAAGEPFARWAILQTAPTNPAVPARVHCALVVAAKDDHDALLAQDITRVTLEPRFALPFEMDLGTLTVHFNVVPATAGRTSGDPLGAPATPFDPADPDQWRFFTIGPSPAGSPDGTVPAIERDGPLIGPEGAQGRPVIFLYSLPGSDQDDLVWLSDVGDPRQAAPELWLAPVQNLPPTWPPTGESWAWRRALVGESSSVPTDEHFTLDDGTWRELCRPGDEGPHLVDYVGDPGQTVRFGDGEFGRTPPAATLFRVIYRLGSGRRANLPAGAITHFAQSAFDTPQAVLSITNPLPSEGGVDPEPADDVRRYAPAAFRATTYRAVRQEDYARAAETLAWVERAGARFRWTGSWLTAFVTPDPRDGTSLGPDERTELGDLLDRYRQAGRPAAVRDPEYADLDVEVTVCVEPTAYPSDVKQRVLAALVGSAEAFFAPDHFTFGTALERSELDAAIQQVAGVRAVESIRVRRRGFGDLQELSMKPLSLGDNVVIRVANDPLHPNRGSIQVLTGGGA